MKINFNLLDWDSKFFGYKVVSVRPLKMELKDLELLIDELKNNDVETAYCFVNHFDEISNNSLSNSIASLADEKVTFAIELHVGDDYKTSSFVNPYKLDYTSDRLKLLALQSGTYSRFKTDKKFQNNEYQKLYIEWIDRSVRKEIASDILVYYKNDEEKGFVSLDIRNETGYIGLVAVDELERGNSIGKVLMNAALHAFMERGIFNVEVVTQKANTIACEFYKSLGFRIIEIENVYHIWIK
jgi:dTDP-4-amino-4,6-dideoxy-D-galactose acyltransferase